MSDPFPTDDNLRMQYMTRHGNGHGVEIHLWSSKQRLIETDFKLSTHCSSKKNLQTTADFFHLMLSSRVNG